jgi:hypothetical protein
MLAIGAAIGCAARQCRPPSIAWGKRMATSPNFTGLVVGPGVVFGDGVPLVIRRLEPHERDERDRQIAAASRCACDLDIPEPAKRRAS